MSSNFKYGTYSNVKWKQFALKHEALQLHILQALVLEIIKCKQAIF